MIEYDKRAKLKAMIQVGDLALAYHRYRYYGGVQHISCLSKFLNGKRPFKKDGWKMYMAILEIVENRQRLQPVPKQEIRDLEQRLAL